jgi:hypothetical protein
MKKIFTLLVIASLSMSAGAQHEMAMNDIGDPLFPITASSRIKSKAPPETANHRLQLKTKTIANLEYSSSFPAAIQMIEQPDFGSDFSVFADTLTGHRIIDLRRQVNELMVFAKNSEGQLVMAQLLYMVNKVELEFPKTQDSYSIEMLTREGDKATIYLD